MMMVRTNSFPFSKSLLSKFPFAVTAEWCNIRKRTTKRFTEFPPVNLSLIKLVNVVEIFNNSQLWLQSFFLQASNPVVQFPHSVPFWSFG